MQEYAGIAVSDDYERFEVKADKAVGGIHSASMRIAKGLAELSDRLDGLRERLGPVLRPSEPHPTLADTSEITRAPSEHGADLAKHAQYLRELLARVNDLHERLDV